MPERLKPYFEAFRKQAERLDNPGIPNDTEAPLILLAQFMSEIEGKMSEEDMFIMTEIGGHLLRKFLKQ